MITYTDMLILIYDYIYRYVNTNPWLHTLIMLILIHDYNAYMYCKSMIKYTDMLILIHDYMYIYININPWLHIHIC